MRREPGRREREEGLLPPESWSTGMVPYGMWLRRYRDNRHPDTRGIALGSTGLCWCGARLGHGWDGKDRGAAHPRP